MAAPADARFATMGSTGVSPAKHRMPALAGSWFLEKGAFRFSKLQTKSLLEMQPQDYSRNRRKGQRPSDCRRQGREFLLYGSDELLDGIDFLFFKVGFATLATHPCRNLVESNMTTPAVGMKGGMASSHFALAVDALHFLTLTLKSSDHSFALGTYAVITAR
jgi:hypothetical protein